MSVFPHSLSSIVGFMLFSAFILSMVMTTETKSEIDTLNNDLQNSISSVLNTENESWFSQILDVGSVIFDTLYVIFAYFANFVGLSTSLPYQFYIFFIIISIGGIIALIKLIRGVWDL